jgi:hypothetical protein
LGGQFTDFHVFTSGNGTQNSFRNPGLPTVPAWIDPAQLGRSSAVPPQIHLT